MPHVSPSRNRGARPLHERVRSRILQMIRERGLAVGDRIPQIRELAKTYNVSYVTAAKAVSSLVDANVLDSRVGDGTYVCEGAVPDEVSPSGITIAAVLRDVYTLDLFNLGATIRTVGGFTQQHGLKMQMLMVHEDESAAGIETLIQDVAAQEIDGLIIASRVDPRLILRLLKERIPFVWVGDELPHHQTYSVMGSRVGGYVQGITALYELGQQKVAVIHPPFQPQATEAMHIVARTRGEKFDPQSDLAVVHERQAVRDATDKLLDAGYDGLVVANEQATAWSQERALELGHPIPAELLYATFAAPASNFPMPAPFVGLCAPMEEMAREACRLLVKLIEKQDQPSYQSIFDLLVLIPNSIRHRKSKR